MEDVKGSWGKKVKVKLINAESDTQGSETSTILGLLCLMYKTFC
jgi:hypothetical protein